MASGVQRSIFLLSKPSPTGFIEIMADSSKHLLYLLPDVAYVVELIQGKDEYTYSVKDYLQINGNFINDKELLGESLKKLVAKIQPKPYDLVLPDFLFTNTIINVEETNETKVKEHLETKVIPDLKISGATHNIQHFVLTKLKDVSRVQLSALEYSVLKPFKDAFGKKNEASINRVYPLSWTIKSLISLEPSISLVQMGTKLYLAQQYIGVDQANYSEVENVTKLVETIKTLKGAEPSIQSLYLLSNELVEKNIKDGLSDTLPIQQLAQPDEDSEMPSYVKQVIEAGARTMVVPDFKLPEFLLDAKPAGGVIKTEDKKEEMPEEKPAKAEKTEETKETEKTETPDLPTPTEIGGDDEGEKKEETEVKEETTDESKPTEETKTEDKPAAEADTLTDTATSPSDISTGGSLAQAAKVEEPTSTSDKSTDDKSADEKAVGGETDDSAIDLSQFSAGSSESSSDSEDSASDEKAGDESKDEEKDDSKDEKEESKDDSKDEDSDQDDSKDGKKDKKVIKNKSGVNSMVKMIFVGLVSFFVTVGVGLGLGLGFLNFTNKTSESPAEEVVAEVSPTEEPVATPTEAPEIDRTTYKVLVVNATTKAGYAGIAKSSLTDAGFEGVDAKNAKGEYEDGYYLLLDEENEALLSLLEEDTGFSLEFSSEKAVEDPSEEYDFVIVLGATE